MVGEYGLVYRYEKEQTNIHMKVSKFTSKSHDHFEKYGIFHI